MRAKLARYVGQSNGLEIGQESTYEERKDGKNEDEDRNIGRVPG
jgi:hypothetical protein